MKITIVNKSDIKGGAALAGYAIFYALNKYTDIKARILCGTKISAYKNIETFRDTKAELLDRLFNRIVLKPTIGQNYWMPSKKIFLNHEFIKKTNLINFHNIHGDYLAYPVLKKLGKKVPIVISMQDMWYLTGHCGFAFNCEKYKDRCIKCPYLNSYPELKHDTSYLHWKNKKRIYKNIPITFVTCSKWLKNEAERSPMMKGKKIYHIYNPVDTNKLKPREKRIVRKLLEIPIDKNVIAFGAAEIDSERKGFPKFLKNITNKFIKKNNLFLIVMGNDTSNIISEIPHFLPFKYFGNIPGEEFRSLIYNAADVFIFPTLADNLPNMLIESLSSGTPCVTFDTGGCGEIVKNEFTGYLAQLENFDDFFQGIEMILHNIELKEKLSKNARDLILKNFSFETCAVKYSNLFKSILNGQPN